ncbi:MAG: hypothetical protein QOG43_2172 [Actinomycetota bacterium]|nr:hypothetical protein [Actinomycetota bacterium]
MTTYQEAPEWTVAGGGPAPDNYRPGTVKPIRPLVIGRFMGTVVVTLHGDVDVAAAAGLARVLHDLVDGQGNLDIAINLGDVHRIDDSGLQALAASATTLLARGGELRMGGPSGSVMAALRGAGLAGLITVPPDQMHPRAPGQPNVSAPVQASMDAHPAGNRWYQPAQETTAEHPSRPHPGWEADGG